MGLGTGVGQRTAVVTGAASPHGIGYATAQRFAEEGWAVVVLDLDEGGAAAAAQSISGATGARAVAYGVDVTDRDRVFQIAARVAESDLPPVGALANVAGIPSPVPFLEVTPELWEKVIGVNLTGVFNTCQAFLPAMIEHGYGRVVNMSSVSAQQGGGVFSKTPYSAAKAGVLGLTRSLAREMAPLGLTVNAICPAIVLIVSTGLMTERALEAASELEKDGIDVSVLHCPTLKPFDEETVLAEVGKDRLVLTAENHTIVGGLFGAVAEAMAKHGVTRQIHPVALPDEFLDAGALPTLYDRYGVSTAKMVERIKKLLG